MQTQRFIKEMSVIWTIQLLFGVTTAPVWAQNISAESEKIPVQPQLREQPIVRQKGTVSPSPRNHSRS
jgi:hypothetical protein